jgi:hypothetical protein
MSVKSYFFNAVEDGGVYDRVYNAEDVTSYLDKIVGNGVFSNPSNSLQVKFIADSQLDVAVLAGQGWIEGHKVVNTSTLQIDLDAADPLLPRIDAIIMYLDLTNRTMGFTFKKGTPAANPTAPSMTRSPNKKEYRLANVRVNAGATMISQSDITDTRGSSDCGWVTVLIDQVDTSTLFTQYEAAYDEAMAEMQAWQAGMQAQFEDWMETLTDQLTVKTFVQFFNKTVTGTGQQVGTISLDMPGYTYDPSDFLIVFINGLVGTEGTNWNRAVYMGQTRILMSLPMGSLDNTVNIYVIKSKIGFAPLVTSEGDNIVSSNDDQIIV